LIYTWITASLILAARLLVTFALGVRLLARALPLNCGKIEEAIDKAKSKLGISRDVKIYGSTNIHSPVIWCWRRRPVLLVPSAAGQSNNGIDWAGVLCHELAHYKRRDHISSLLAELVVCILPWQLFLWLAKSRLIRLSEQACDDWVVASGRPGTDYAESLLNLTPGDWILRNEAPPEAKKQAIEKLIADEFGRNITIRNSIEQRDVIVATGQFKFSPVYSNDTIFMFADEDESVRKKGETVLNGTNTIGQFLQHLESLVSVPVIDRTKVMQDTHIEYRAHLSWPSIRRIKNISEKKDKLRFFLDTLSAQTNLQFEITREPIEVWFVTEDTEN